MDRRIAYGLAAASGALLANWLPPVWALAAVAIGGLGYALRPRGTTQR